MNNPMKEAPVNSLMIKMGTPIILSMMMQALYNIVDSAFVSNMVIAGITSNTIIWFTFIIAEVLTAVVGYIMLKRIVKNSLSFRVI